MSYRSGQACRTTSHCGGSFFDPSTGSGLRTSDVQMRQTRKTGPLVITIAIAVATALLYGWRLQEAPIYVSPDEAIISVDAHSLASTGYDVHGRFLPLYFQVQLPGETRMGWFTPAIFYLSALFLKVLPLSEATIRLPTVLVGVADVVLMYLIGRRLFQRESSAIVASV